MAVFKCKMCGAALNLQGDEKIIECEFCGTQQTLPRLTDETRENLYDRANHFRRNNDYDKATSIYEQLLNEDNTDAEAYWSIVLCRYGIEYVQDPATKKRVPTINRMQYTSILADEDYKSALQYADFTQKKIYESEGKAIDKLQKGILAISQAEEPFDVFICYKETDNNGRRTPDSVLAQELYYGLKEEGFKVFFARITLEDKLGSAYEPYIFAALNSAKAMVVLGTQPEHFKAVWVKNEWSRYLSLIKKGEKKTLIPAYKGMDPYDLPDEFSHLQAQDMSKLGFMQDLIRGVKKLVNANKKKEAPQVVVQQTAPTGNISALLTRMQMSIEDGEFDQADRFAEQILNQDPTNAQAYLGKLMAEFKVKNKEDLGQFGDALGRSTNYIRLLRFGDKKLIEEIQGYAVAYQEKQRQAQLESAYQDACRLMRKGEYESAANHFASISEYKDSAVLREECRQKALLKHKETKYNTAKGLMESGNIEQVKHSKSIFESIKDYKDSLQLSRECDEIIEQLKAAEAKRKKKQKRALLIGAAAVVGVVSIIGASIGIANAQQEKAYNEALLLAKEGKYAEAYDAFKSIDKENHKLAKACLQAEKGVYVGIINYYDYTTFTIPDSVTSIGEEAFEDCSSLTSVVIPDSVTSIGDWAFGGCSSLTSVEIPDSVTSIGKGAFSDCSGLTSVVIPDSVTSIDWSAFSDCSGLTSVVIGDSVTSIGNGAFLGCSNLASVEIGDSVTSIGYDAFSGCSSLTEIVIPDSVTSIEEKAFYGCSNLTSIVIPDSVTRIGIGAFENCSSLTEITLPFVGATKNETLYTHFGYIFDAISYSSNYNCIPTSLKKVTITGGSIGDYAFDDCDGLTSVVIGNSVTSIGLEAFKGCSSLTSVVIGNSVTSIGERAFWACRSLTSIVLPDSVKSISEGAFLGCSNLTSVVIPDSVTSIGEEAFGACSSLTKIVIPDSVKSIGYAAFRDCSSLNIYCEAESKPYGWNSNWTDYNWRVVWGYKGE